MAKKLLIIAGATLFLALGGIWLIGSALSAPTPAAVADAVPPAGDVWIKTADEVDLAGTYRSGHDISAPGIVLLHGNGASRAATDGLAAWLSEQGFATLAIDFRGHGESDEADHSFGLFEARDAKAAFDWMIKQQGGARVGVIGISLGGAAALLGDEGPLPAHALVLQAVYPDIRSAIRNRLASRLGSGAAALGEPVLSYQSLLRQGVWPDRLSPLTAARKLKAPTLVIGGANDVYTPPSETQALHDVIPAPQELWLVDGLDHAQVSGGDDPAYRARILRFMDQHLRKP